MERIRNKKISELEKEERIKIIAWYVDESGYNSPPQDGKGNYVYNKIVCEINLK